MSASDLMLGQAKWKKKAMAAGGDRDDPMQTNPFYASAGVHAAVGALVTLIVCNADVVVDKDPNISMFNRKFPDPDDFRDMLYRLIDESKLLNGDGANEAVMEVGRIVYNNERELALLINMSM